MEDFERRVRFSEGRDARSILRRLRSTAWVVHPAADETELLAELGIHPSDCRSIDAYWRYGDSVYWVEFVGSRVSAGRNGIYYSFRADWRQDQFRIALSAPVVTTGDLHRGFDRLERLIDSGAVEAARAGLPYTGESWSARTEPLEEAW